MQDYATKGYSARGASMGRASTFPSTFAGHVFLRQVPIDAGGYDPGGAYWGTGTPLFCLSNEDGDTDYFRAKDMAAARTYVASEFPDVTISDPTEVTESDILEMREGYLTCALFTGTDDEDEPLDNRFSTNDIDQASLVKAHKDCELFTKATASYLLAGVTAGHSTWNRIGQLFWYDRNGHGIGFNDEFPKEEAAYLSKAADIFREVRAYVIDEDADEVQICIE